VAATLTHEGVAQFLPRVHAIASRFRGQGGAEYDDLVQEASEYVCKQIRNGKQPTGTGMRNAMRTWVRKCRNQGMTHGAPVEE
jgi:DNA-directed RNA polymerase specialized sigma24 family protein